MGTAAKKTDQAEIIDITNGKFKHKLSTATTIEGTVYTDLELDFDNLTGQDMIEAARNRDMLAPQKNAGDYGAAAMGGIMPELDRTYQAFIAARAAGVHPNVILGLKARDFNAITRATVIFLLGSASEA